MKFLLTNDDGYNAPGILLLKDKLLKYGEVTIVAPFKHMSGKGASITIGEWQKVDKIDDHTYAVHGTPTDCATMALAGLNIDCDIVVSGCNNGPNLSYDVLLSGTIGACFGAAVFRKKSIAFSAPFDDFTCLIEHFDEIWEYIMKYNLLSKDYVLNVNLPKGEYKGIALARLHYRKDRYYYDQNGDTYYALRDTQEYLDMPEDSDCRLVKEGYVVITPINRAPFDESQFEELKKKVHQE